MTSTDDQPWQQIGDQPDGWGARALDDDTLASNLTSATTCQQRLLGLETKYPEWFSFYDSVGGDYAPLHLLHECLERAPHPLLAMMVFGALNVRMQLADLQGSNHQRPDNDLCQHA